VSSVLDVQGLTKSYGGRILFPGVDFSLHDGEKVGIIGRNGSGKSTLLRILAGEEAPDEGTLAYRKDLRVAFLPQLPEVQPDRTIFETAGEGMGDLPALLRRYDRVNGKLGADPPPSEAEALLAEQSRLASRIEALGGWDAGHRIEAILTRLGIQEWDRTMGTLSGGEARRVALARTLLTDPELLLLDEPTNHLDADTVLWLEETLFDFAGAVLVVTHDRYFLDRVVDRMVEVSTHGLSFYEGGYTEYLQARALRKERMRVEEAKRTKLLEKELAWARRSPPARTGKQKARRERAREMARTQKEEERHRVGQVELEQREGPRLGRTVLELEEVRKSYEGRTVLAGVSDRLQAGERIGVVGPNGAGKSTLLRIVIGEEEPDEGSVVLGQNTKIGYLAQDRELDPEMQVGRVVADSDWVEVDGGRIHLKAYLDRFLFPPHLHEQRVASLSGGERTRLLLARLFLQSFNLLVLDEPTNDLDLETLQVLEDVIEGFQGCVLVVTHDRFLLDKVATSLLVFEGEGRVRRHHGRWDDYLARREEARAREVERAREEERQRREVRAEAGRKQARRAREGKQKLTFREQRELETLEAEIAQLEEEKDTLGDRLGDPAFYQGSSEEVARTTGRLKEVEASLERHFERWMELQDRAG